MKKFKLSYMIIMIIGFTTLLLINAMGIFAYRDAVLSAETHKDNLLNFNIKYNNLYNILRSDAKLYLTTNDEIYKTEFLIIRDEYLLNDRIYLKFHTQTEVNTPDYNGKVSTNGLTLSAQADYLGFTKYERRIYNDFKGIYNKLLDDMTNAVNEKDMDILTNHEHVKDYITLTILLDRLSESYIDRMNADSELIVKRQNILEVTLILLSLALICLGSLTVVVLLKENRHNSYFRQLYNTVVENVNVGICIMDKDYNYEYMNSMYREIMNVEGDYTGKSIRQIYNHNIVKIIEETTSHSSNGGGEADLYIGNHRKHLNYNYFTIYDENSNSKSVHLIQDYTMLEDMRLQLLKQLKEIEFYSQAKDTFIANFSHEIKTPINAILGMVHFLKNTKLSDNQKELVNKIETSSDILITIISDVLDLSKIKSKTLNLYPTNFCLAEVIKNVEDMFTAQMADKGLEWITDYRFDKGLCLHMDKTRFVQVLVNLINNAYKFTDTGHIKLSVDTIFENSDLVELEFYVEDTGIGIAEKDISKLFNEFEQLENHLTKQHQGTGLGLFICKNIIESMDGRIWVTSTKGYGSRFYFSIPAEKAYETETLSASSSNSGDHLMDGNGSKVLVVEDTEINMEVAVKLLNDVNISCDMAGDGLEAVNMCRGKAPNYYKVILMDIHMPNMDGYTAAKILKNDMGILSPIIALTASDINEETRKEHADTINEFILKPFKASAFYKTLSPYFGNRNKDVRIDDYSTEEKTEDMNGHLSDPITSEDPFAGREEAIKNLGGMENIYNKHVNKFKTNYAESADQIEAFLLEKNYDEARRLAHSIKGLGGTLGMLTVQRTAADLEKAILQGEGYDIASELNEFDKAIKAAVKAAIIPHL